MNAQYKKCKCGHDRFWIATNGMDIVKFPTEGDLDIDIVEQAGSEWNDYTFICCKCDKVYEYNLETKELEYVNYGFQKYMNDKEEEGREDGSL